MYRRKFDQMVSLAGVVLAVVLGVAGALLLWGGNFAHGTVTTELTGQRIAFSANAEELPPELQDLAGVAVIDGPTAQAYAELIDGHLAGMAGGQTYSEVSAAWIEGGRSDETLADQRMTLFMGETLRGLLLNAYAFWTVGTIAIFAAWGAFAASALMFLLAGLGFIHMSRTDLNEVIFDHAASSR